MNAADLRAKALHLRLKAARSWSHRKARRLTLKAHNLERAALLADQARQAHIAAFDAEQAASRAERERRIAAFDAERAARGLERERRIAAHDARHGIQGGA